MKKKILILTVCTLLFLMLYTGCGSSAPKEAYDGARAEESMTEVYVSDSAEYDKSTSENKAEPETDVENRKLIETVTLTIETKNFEAFTSTLKSSVKAFGGYIEYSDIGSYSGQRRNAEYTLRIPAKQLDEFLSKVSEGVSVVSKTDSVDDVTLKYVDMQSHLKALRTEEESLLRLLASAESVEDIITVQDRLTQVRYEIESYESQLRTYDNLIDYATVRMNVREVEIETDLGDNPSVWKEIGNNLSENMYGIGQFFRSLFVFLVSALPVILVIAIINVPIIIFAIVLPIKRHKKKLAEKAAAETQTEE